MPSSPRTAILLIAHGSRRREANEDLARVAELVAERRPDDLVEISFLEIASPTISEGGAACVGRGAEKVRMLPFFLSPGSHVVEDLERHRRELSAQFPTVRFVLCPPLGIHPRLIDVLMARLEEGEGE